MRFREFLEEMEMEEGRVGDFLKRGVVGGALALSHLVAGLPQASADQGSPVASKEVERDEELISDMKDEGRYWGRDATRRLVKAAMGGDEWAAREIAWPKGHPLHKKGRPFFRNDKPHPRGEFPLY